VQKLLRFTAYCKVTFIASLQDVAVRWDVKGNWDRNQSALLARPLACSLSAPAE
jgi:hypothetical protein